MLSYQMLGWAGLDFNTEQKLDDGLHPGPTEDKTVPFPWQGGRIWDTGKSGGETL